jgi:IPTL-CTERM motif
VNIGNGSNTFIFNQSPVGLGQFGFFGFSPPKTNAGGVLALTLGPNIGGMFTCNMPLCTGGSAMAGRHLVSGTISAPVAQTVTVTVPTLTQWGLLILGLLMASLAAWQVRRTGRR